MKISVFVVTYKNEDLLTTCLTSITKAKHVYQNHSPTSTVSVTVLDNAGDLVLTEPDVHVINNLVRPLFSTGHLARSWNECIMHGFKDINEPACDALVLIQNDVVICSDAFVLMEDYLTKYRYIQFGHGDELQVMTPESVKQIGMYDERFCNIGFQEADYFLRAVLLYKEFVSINDIFHGRVHNPLDTSMLVDVPSGFMRGDVYHLSSSKHHNVSYRMFLYKWMGILPFRCLPSTCLRVNEIEDKFPVENWDDYIKNIPVCAKQYIMYPYFECKLPDLEQKYINFTNYYM